MTHPSSPLATPRVIGVLAAVLLATSIPATSALAEPTSSAGRVVGPQSGRAAHHDISQPLSVIGRHLGPAPPTSAIEIPHLKRQRTYPPNVSYGADTLRQQAFRPDPAAAVTPLPTMNFDGLANIDGVLPPDTNGDVGLDYYVQWINLSFEVFDKATGVPVPGGPYTGQSLWDGFAGACGSPNDSPACACQETNDGDPIVLFDHLANRWLLSQFAIDQGVQCVALSTTSDPLGSYERWAFEVSPGQQNDYPKIGVMPEAYYMTVRDFPSNVDNFAGFVAFDRLEMLAGTADPGFIKFGLTCDATDCVDGVQPPHLEGPAPASGTHGLFTKVWDDDFEGDGTGPDGYRIFEMIPDFDTQESSVFNELPIVPASADFDTNLCGGARACIPQPPLPPPDPPQPDRCRDLGIGCPYLDAFGDTQMYRSQFRHWGSHNTLVLTNAVDIDGADTSGVRWVELRDTGAGGTWTVFQEGTYAPADGDNRWMSSAAMDSAGNIAVGYSVSSFTTYPSVRYATRESGDALGTLPGGEVEMIAGTGTQSSTSYRWGDYSSMSVDPTDDCTFWFTQEYIQTTGSANWRTRIGSFRLPSCVSGCPFNATETLTGAEGGTVEVTACQKVTVGPYEFTGGSLTVTAGETIDFIGDTSIAVDAEFALDALLASP